MIGYKITKYDPKKRIDGIYTAHEWTSISDIGSLFDDGILTYNQYMQVERRYINCCLELLREADISELFVRSPEYYYEDIRFPNILYEENDIRYIIMCCLREKCWVKLENRNFFIHFGYDYNMYIGTNLPVTFVYEATKRHSLFCEKMDSPYGGTD